MISEANENMQVSTGKAKGRRVFLIAASGVLLVALAVAAVFVFRTSADRVDRVLDFHAVMSGVSVNGVDISGLADEEAKAATEGLSKELLNAESFLLNVNGETHTYALEDLSVGTDYEDIIAQAIEYGHTGSFEDRKVAYDAAKNDGVAFTVSLQVEEEKLRVALVTLKTELDQAPQEAKAEFMPFGYTLAADGTPVAFEPDPKEMADLHAKYKEIERPALVRIPETDMPNKLRYQFWNENHYEKEEYIPKDADIARFFYTPEVTGIDVNTDAIAEQVTNAVSSGDFSEIEVPVEVTEPELKLDDIKADTQLIASWTSSYRGHKGPSRNWNVSRMSSFINGVIQPGEEFSVNDTAGYRNSKTAREIGWKKAAGIENGGYTQQYGGGVCQLGSTTYNAAIRANLYIVTSTHHTIPSGYIPLGLDATLSTPKPDLVLRNDNTMPVYLVSYVDPKKMTVTVEIYGQLPVDPTYGEGIIYNFTSNNKGSRYGSPGTRVIESAVPITAPDGTVVDASHPSYTYAKPSSGTAVQTYKEIYSSDGTPLCDPIEFQYHRYPVINGTTYVYTPPAPPAPPAPDVPVDNQTPADQPPADQPPAAQ